MKIKQITNPDNNMWRSADPPQRAERVAARIGGGGLKVIDQEHGLSDKSGSVFKQSLRQINDRILENNDIECIANGLSSNDKLTIDMNEVPERLQAELITDYDEFRQMIADAQSIHHNEPDVYFYHSDHLGSASWITDNGGLAVQHLQYLPYGERYVDQRISGYSERFTFTGKERDEETGYGYFGARYMDHELMTMWLSVDPMADKYPSLSPYNYCAWNPVKLVDPDGRKIIIKDGNKSYYYINGHVYSNENGHGLQFDSELGKEASKIKNNLDEMRKDNAGAKVVGRLIKSEETYTIAADAKTGDGSYRASSNKVSLVSGKLNNMESLSHELFHAYQDDNGRIPHTVYNEVEAYIFSGMMSGKPTMGMMSDKNPEYTKHANNLKKGFSNRSFNYLVSHFRRDSKANTLRGTYKSYEYNPGKYTISQSLLRNLYK